MITTAQQNHPYKISIWCYLNIWNELNVQSSKNIWRMISHILLDAGQNEPWNVDVWVFYSNHRIKLVRRRKKGDFLFWSYPTTIHIHSVLNNLSGHKCYRYVCICMAVIDFIFSRQLAINSLKSACNSFIHDFTMHWQRFGSGLGFLFIL